MFDVGDLIEPCSDQTLLTPGLYQVLAIEGGAARLSPLSRHAEEELGMRLNRITFVPVDVLTMFSRVTRPAPDRQSRCKPHLPVGQVDSA